MPTGRAADGSMLHAPTDEERTCYEKLEKLLIFPPGVLGAVGGAVFGACEHGFGISPLVHHAGPYGGPALVVLISVLIMAVAACAVRKSMDLHDCQPTIPAAIFCAAGGYVVGALLGTMGWQHCLECVAIVAVIAVVWATGVAAQSLQANHNEDQVPSPRTQTQYGSVQQVAIDSYLPK